MSDLLVYKNVTKTKANYFYIVGEFIKDSSKIMLQMKTEDTGTVFIKIEDMIALYVNVSQEIIDTYTKLI